MYVKKRMSLLLFAALAMVLFTACGRWDFSREAAKAANEAQNAVVFEASATLAQSLKDALEDKVQISDVKAAMEADERLADLLGRLDVYAVEGDDAEAAAQTIAEGYIKGRVSGRQSDGSIAMVKADNGYFYEAVLTYKHGSSGSSSGGASDGDNDPDAPVVPDDGKVTVTVTTSGDSENVTVTGDKQTVEKGTDVSFTFTRDFYDKLTSIKVNDDEIFDTTDSDRFSVSYANDMDHTYTFTLKNVQEDTTIAIGFEKATPLTDEASLVHTGTTTAVANPMPCAVGPFILENLDVRIPLNNSNNWDDSGDWLVYNLNLPNSQGVESAEVEPENINGDTDKVEIRVKINSPNAGVNQEFTFTYGVTVNPTKSAYGESSYLTKDELKNLENNFKTIVQETLNKKVSSGENDPIQQAMNEATSGSNIGSALKQLKEEGTISSYQYLATVTEENAIDLQNSINDKLRSFNKEDYDRFLNSHIYMTIKDGANGQIECYIYTVEVAE